MPPTLRTSDPARAARAVAAVLAVIGLLLLAGCRPPAERAGDAARVVEARVVDEPARVGPATIEVEVRHDASPVDGAAVRVTGDMTHAGMVAVVADAAPLGDGRYRTTDFAFTMAGDWILTIDVTYPDAATRLVAVPLSVAR